MVEICERCTRPTLSTLGKSSDLHGELKKAYVVHAYYGCDTGCCGSIAVAEDAAGNQCRGSFQFDHPYDEEPMVWARHFVAERFPGIPFSEQNCEIIND